MHKENPSVETKHRVRKEKGKKIPHIVGSNAIVDPRAVVIEAGNTCIASAAMLRSGWSTEIACAAYLSAIDYSVVLEPSQF
jgi:hypothetical protein